MNVRAGDAIARKAALPGAEHIALAAQFQIFFGNPEAVGGFTNDLQPRCGHLVERLAIEQQTDRRLRAAADPASELVQLRKSEPFGVLDDHDRRGRYVDAHLDDGRRHQNVNVAGGELRHHPVLVGAGHLAMDKADLVAEPLFETFKSLFRIGQMIDGFGFLHQRTNPVNQFS